MDGVQMKETRILQQKTMNAIIQLKPLDGSDATDSRVVYNKKKRK